MTDLQCNAKQLSMGDSSCKFEEHPLEVYDSLLSTEGRQSAGRPGLC